MREKKEPTIQLEKGDCLQLMRAIPEKSIDMILCDLPYGVTQNKWDIPLPFDDLWAQYKRVIKDNGAIVLFGQEPFLSELRMSNIKWFKYDWIWYKHYSRNFLNARKQPLRNTERISVFYNKQCTYNPRMRKGIYRAKGLSGRNSENYGKFKEFEKKNDTYYPTEILDFVGVGNGKARRHNTEKPVELLKYLIETYTNAGETVLDNCAGSGSTGEACLLTGRNFIGYEMDDNYFAIAKERLEGVQCAIASNMQEV